MDLGSLVASLARSDNQTAYENLKLLEAESARSNAVYRYFDTFIEMLDHDNSYVRTRAIILISANAKWDTDYKIDENITRLLRHIEDVKPITARQCIQRLPELAKHKPELREDVLTALRKVHKREYAGSMQPLIHKDIALAIKRIESYTD